MGKRVLFIDESDVRFYNALLGDSFSVCTNETICRKWISNPLCSEAVAPILELTVRINEQSHPEAQLAAYTKDKEHRCIADAALSRLDGTFWLKLPDGSEVGLDVIPVSSSRILTCMRKLIEDVRDVWSSGYKDVMEASTLTVGELESLGYPDASLTNDEGCPNDDEHCPKCGAELVFHGDEDNGYGELKRYWECPNCKATGTAVYDESNGYNFDRHEVD